MEIKTTDDERTTIVRYRHGSRVSIDLSGVEVASWDAENALKLIEALKEAVGE